MPIINFLVNQIFRQPPLFLGLVALVGLIIQKKDFSYIIKGTCKTIVGVIILMKGVDIIVSAINPIAEAFNKIYAIPEKMALSPLGVTKFIEQYGSIIGVCMILAFIINLIVAKFTRFKNVFLTGHIFFWMSFIFVALGVELKLTTIKLIIYSTSLLALYIIITPALIRPFVKKVTGDDSFTIGHTTVGFSLIGAFIGKFLGDKSKSTEDIKIPDYLDFLRDTTITTGIVMFLVYIVVGIFIGTDIRTKAFGAEGGPISALITYSIIKGLTFSAGLTVLLLGVRLMFGEIVPAFNGIAERFIPDAVPALDCPMIFPYAPNAVLIGFVLSMISSIITIIIFAAIGCFNYAILPLTVACFFDIGPAAVFANATGGRRGAIIASIVCGFLLISFEALSIGFLRNTVSDFIQAFGGNDFSIWTIIVGLFNRIFVQ